jgi:hypothetical protein
MLFLKINYIILQAYCLLTLFVYVKVITNLFNGNKIYYGYKQTQIELNKVGTIGL